MNEFLAIFITWQFLVLCLGIAAVTFIVRTIVEFAILNNPRMPGNSSSRLWRDVILVILPILLGILFFFVGKSFAYPTAITESYGKFLFSAVAGLLSPTLYRVIKAMLWNQANINPTPSPYTPNFPPNPSPFPLFPPTNDPNIFPPVNSPIQNVNVNVNAPPTAPINPEQAPSDLNQDLVEPKI